MKSDAIEPVGLSHLVGLLQGGKALRSALYVILVLIRMVY
jgi:hypothetical protein